ncbi:hypothetical protein BU24DRAFT_378663 [Aaosphaeria arxii CBS 175.79]|uniref:Zn(2)-C6 fungal-type domain-containing protein n=1 Tax=Aaosphaeria arxii CBS 175.79 TaxID=1450172 RepID=A0A6A5XBV1_9PLEO|nr:uncharacterized protein BU24DRAFT_378663 [Aaosphaeria arxii CBS 175.79]KAF2010565.1 hypothetical protein BU24DRAFT_378663 [Aaosphaeria arxii CBS 175.79]
MTQVGKCDTCRARKVKCDEKKPKCGACRKKERSCTYTYGKASALVLETPTKYSGHGKAKVAPRIVPLVDSENSAVFTPQASSISSSDVEADRSDVDAAYQLDGTSPETWVLSRQGGLQRLSSSESSRNSTPSSSGLSLIRPSSPEMSLATRFIKMIGPESQGNPFLIHGTWVNSIPTRIGCSPAFDTAVKYAIDSFAFFSDPSFSKQRIARQSKGVALKALRDGLAQVKGNVPFDILLAIKMHFNGEILMGVENWVNYTTHSMALSEILKSRSTPEIADEDYWSFIDNTYMDEIAEAAFSGRQSKFENDFYLNVTRSPPTGSSHTQSLRYRVAMTLMHSLIQVPRMIKLVRDAKRDPDDVEALAKAVSSIESLWQIMPTTLLEEYYQAVTSKLPISPGPELQGFIDDTLYFESVESVILLNRFWTLQNYLCGVTYTLYDSFPLQSAASALPSMETVERVDIAAASNVLRSVPYALSISSTLHLVPLRILTPMQTSIGAWYRKLRRLRILQLFHEQGSPEHDQIQADIKLYETAQDHIVRESNKIHLLWRADIVTMPLFAFACEILEGGHIPEDLLQWMQELHAGKDVPRLVVKINKQMVEIAMSRDPITGASMPMKVVTDEEWDEQRQPKMHENLKILQVQNV